jgi:hypothetical protein
MRAIVFVVIFAGMVLRKQTGGFLSTITAETRISNKFHFSAENPSGSHISVGNHVSSPSL